MVKVILHGDLCEDFGYSELQLKVKTKKEVMKALCANFPGFRTKLQRKAQDGLFYRMVDEEGNICEEIKDYDTKCPEEIHLVPSIIGSGPVGLILAGGGLSYFGGYTALAGSFLGKMLFNIGVSLLIQGIQLLLAGEQQGPTQEVAVETQSFIFQNTNNTVVQGFGIPIIYGQIRLGSKVISTNLESVDISVEA